MNNRRNFLKQALALTGVAATSTLGFSKTSLPETFNSELLNEEEIFFLSQFKTWVDNCTKLVKLEKQKERWLKNNQGIMEIAEQAETWMPKAKAYMPNREFRKQFLAISDHLTQLIEDNSVAGFSKSL
jgi:hypothetical protein